MFRRLIIVLFGALLCSQLALAQVNTATISGVVRDSTGGVIPGATVVMNNLDTGISRTVTTDAQGRYHAPNLTLGNYEVQTQVSGFRTEVRSGIKLTVGREAVVDFTLSVGDIAQSVQVTGEAPLINTTSAAISGLVDEMTIRDLPLNGRSFDQLVLLQVGALGARRASGAGGAGAGGILEGGAKVSIAGARPQQNTFLLDGTDVNDYRNAMPGSAAGVFLGVDTVREFRVLTNSYSAEYGRSSGGTITAVTRSGTNDLHGSVFAFHRNDDLDARNFFDREQVPPFVRNQFGFTLGGPLRKNQSFFFGSYEGLRERLGVTQRITVPNQLAREGRVPVSGQLQDIGVVAAVRPVLDIYPLPNGPDFGNGTAEFAYGTSRATNENFFATRLDHTLSAKHSIFGRYTFDDGERSIPRGIPIERGLTESRNQYVTLELGSIISPTVLNALRFGYNRSHTGEETLFQDGAPAAFSYVPGIPFETGGLFEVTGLISIGNQRDPQGFVYNLFEWSDDLTVVRGRHSFKTGAIVKRIRLNRNTVSGKAGVYRFTGGLTAFLQGRAGQFLAEVPGTDSNRGWRTSLVGFYLQDDFKLLPSLTLNLGLREEFMTSPNEVNGKSARWPDVMMEGSVVGNPFFDTSKFNLAPRVGFAWDSRQNGKLVVRGGFGMFYDQPMPTYWLAAGGLVPPFNQSIAITSPPYPNAFQTITPGNIRIGDIRGFNYTGTGYALQYNLMIQTEVVRGTGLSVGYIGSQGRKLMRTGQMNIKYPTILSDGRQFFAATAPRRNPRYENVRIEHSDANSNYNALVASMEKQWRRGIRIQGSYTFSKTMSDAETVHGADFVSGEHQVMDPYDTRADRAPASFDIKHNFVLSYTYGPPLALAGVAGKVLNGWQISGITTTSSGVPFPIQSLCCSNNGSSGSTIADRPNLAPGKSNNPVLGGPDRYYDVTAFELPERGFYGNLGRNTVIGPGLLAFDLSLIKNTTITETANLQFRAEFFNLFNRANFSTPALQAFDQSGNRVGEAGRIRSTDTSSRQIQFSLKFVF